MAEDGKDCARCDDWQGRRKGEEGREEEWVPCAGACACQCLGSQHRPGPAMAGHAPPPSRLASVLWPQPAPLVPSCRVRVSATTHRSMRLTAAHPHTPPLQSSAARTPALRAGVLFHRLRGLARHTATLSVASHATSQRHSLPCLAPAPQRTAPSRAPSPQSPLPALSGLCERRQGVVVPGAPPWHWGWHWHWQLRL